MFSVGILFLSPQETDNLLITKVTDFKGFKSLSSSCEKCAPKNNLAH